MGVAHPLYLPLLMIFWCVIKRVHFKNKIITTYVLSHVHSSKLKSVKRINCNYSNKIGFALFLHMFDDSWDNALVIMRYLDQSHQTADYFCGILLTLLFHYAKIFHIQQHCNPFCKMSSTKYYLEKNINFNNLLLYRSIWLHRVAYLCVTIYWIFIN